MTIKRQLWKLDDRMRFALAAWRAWPDAILVKVRPSDYTALLAGTLQSLTRYMQVQETGDAQDRPQSET